MIDYQPLRSYESDQSRYLYSAGIFTFVFIIHIVILTLIWTYRAPERDTKTPSLHAVKFFESFIYQSHTSSHMTESTQAAPVPALVHEPKPSPEPSTLLESVTAPEMPPALQPATVSQSLAVKPRLSISQPSKPAFSEESPAKHVVPINQDTTPSSHANYLNNPQPLYPRKSRRLGEQGKVVLSVEVDPKGNVSQITISQSSGHPRLDQSALETVLKWRFVAGKKAGVPQKMWVNIPINFVLE